MPPKLFLTFLLAVSGLLISCRKSSPAPAATYSHRHTFNTVLGVVPPEKEQAEQPAAQLRGSAQLTATTLEITVAADPEEQLVLSVPRGELTSDFIGQYPLRDPTLPGAGTVGASYTYFAPAGTSRQPQLYHNAAPATYPCGGTLLVSDYDAKHDLISGSYHVDYSFVPNPKLLADNRPDNWQITLEGDFKNLKIKQ